MCANNMPKVVTWKRNSWDLNQRPFELQVQNSNHYATRPCPRTLTHKNDMKKTAVAWSLPSMEDPDQTDHVTILANPNTWLQYMQKIKSKVS